MMPCFASVAAPSVASGFSRGRSGLPAFAIRIRRATSSGLPYVWHDGAAWRRCFQPRPGSGAGCRSLRGVRRRAAPGRRRPRSAVRRFPADRPCRAASRLARRVAERDERRAVEHADVAVARETDRARAGAESARERDDRVAAGASDVTIQSRFATSRPAAVVVFARYCVQNQSSEPFSGECGSTPSGTSDAPAISEVVRSVSADAVCRARHMRRLRSTRSTRSTQDRGQTAAQRNGTLGWSPGKGERAR